MYNPTTGEVIVDEECCDNSKSLTAYWLDELFDKPLIKNDTLREAWEAFVEKFKVDHDCYPRYDDIAKFLEDYDNYSWISYKITSYGIACGLVYSTVMFVVDKEVIVEEIDN